MPPINQTKISPESYRGPDLYPKVLHRIIEGIRCQWLFEYDTFATSADFPTNLPSVLIRNGHDRLIPALIARDRTLKIRSQVIDGYLENGDHSKIFEILARGVWKQSPDLLLGLFENLLQRGASGDELLQCASFIAASEHNIERDDTELYRALTTLWAAEKYTIAQRIIEQCYPTSMQPCILAENLVRSGISKELSDIEEAIKDSASVLSKDDANGRAMSKAAVTARLSSLLQAFTEKLTEPELILHTYDTANRIIAGASDTSIRLDLDSQRRYALAKVSLAAGKFHTALELVSSSTLSSWLAKQIAREVILYAKTNHDLVLFRLGVNHLARIIDQDNALILSPGSATKDPTKLARYNRLSFYEGLAEKNAELALYELMCGNIDKAAPFISGMIEAADALGISPPNCPKPHQISNTHHRRFVKKDLKRKFLAMGFLESLPKTNGWNTPLKHADEIKQKEEDRNRHAKQYSDWMISSEESALQRQNEVNQQLVREAQAKLESGEVASLIETVVQSAEMYRGALEVDWSRASMILEVQPDSFEVLVKPLTGSYFEAARSHDTERCWSGLAQFYATACRLGKLTTTNWTDLYGGLRGISYHFREPTQLPHRFVTNFIRCLTEQGSLDKAWEFYNIVAGRSMPPQFRPDALRSSTHQVCLAYLLQSALTARLKHPGVHACLTGQTFPESSRDMRHVEFWNTESEVRRLEVPNLHRRQMDENGPSARELEDERSALERVTEADRKVLEYCKSAEATRIFAQLLRAGTGRNPHEIKSALLAIHAAESATERSRLRTVATLIEHEIPGAEIMNEVGRKDTPREYTKYFLQLLTSKGILHSYTAAFLTPENKYLHYLRQLISEFPNQFNTVMGTVKDHFHPEDGRSGSRRFLADTEEGPRIEEKDWAGILTILRTIGVCTPGVLAEARAQNYRPAAIRDIQRKIDRLKPQVLSSAAIELDDTTPELLAEIIYAAFMPANLSLHEVISLCKSLQDCSHHLARFEFPAEGYTLDLRPSIEMKKRKPELRISSLERAQALSNNLRRGLESTESAKVDRVRSTVKTIFNLGRFKSLFDTGLDEVIQIYSRIDYVEKCFHAATNAKSEHQEYRALGYLQEIFGIFLKDNIESAIRIYLSENREHVSRMIESFANWLRSEGAQRVYEQQCKILLDPKESDVDLIARAIGTVIDQKLRCLAELRKAIKTDLRQFVTVEGKDIDLTASTFRVYISKNIASFFAKANAGLCTDKDVALFYRADHFHFNPINCSRIVCAGNVMGYIIPFKNKPFLLIRGLNPSVTTLKEVSVESFCDEMLRIAEQFARRNRLAGVLLSEQGNFKALSNREQVVDYIYKKHGDKAFLFDAPVQIATSENGTIHGGFLIVEFEEHNLTTLEEILYNDSATPCGASVSSLYLPSVLTL